MKERSELGIKRKTRARRVKWERKRGKGYRKREKGIEIGTEAKGQAFCGRLP